MLHCLIRDKSLHFKQIDIYLRQLCIPERTGDTKLPTTCLSQLYTYKLRQSILPHKENECLPLS